MVGPNEMVVLVSMELRINDVSGMMNLCLPHVVMEPAIQRLSQGTMAARKSKSAPARQKEALRESLAAAELSLDIDLGHTTLSLRELLDLEPGDVLRFTSASPSGIVAQVEGTPKFEGSAGRSRGAYAVRVERTLNRNESSGGKGGGA